MKWLRNWLEIIIGACLVVLVTTTFLQVVFRFLLKIPSPWTEEVTRIAFVYMIFVGAVLGVKNNAHLVVDVLGKFTFGVRKTIILIGYLLVIGFVGVFTYTGLMHTIASRAQTTPTLDISMMWMYIIMPISGVFMLYYLVRTLITEMRITPEGDDAV